MSKNKENEVIDGESTILELNVENIPTEDDNIEIYSETQPFSLTMYLDPNYDQAYFSKFIKGVEKSVRGNEDYKMWLSSLRDLDEFSNDAFLKNVSSTDAEIQLHHHPFNLYTICSAVTRKMLDKGMKVSTFIVADTVIRNHFRGNIGLVPLAVSMHELAHLGQLNIIRTQIIGHWEEFYTEYKDYFSDFELEIVRDLVETKALTPSRGIVKQLGTHKVTIEEIPEDENEEHEAEEW